MVGIVSGNGMGLASGSAGTLGQQGVFGNPNLGSAGETAFVNISNGNLVLRDQDEFIASLGIDLALTRTYNGAGSTAGNGWRTGGLKQLSNLTGTVNTAGSTISLTDGDSNSMVYTYDATLARYVTTDGGGGYNYLTANAGTQQWAWTSDRRDLGGVYDIYDWPNTGGWIKSRNDQMGLRLNYIYNSAGQIQQIKDASSDTLQFTWSGSNITQVSVQTASGATSTRSRYIFDDLNRLSQVVVDLTPDDNSISDGNTYTTTYTYYDNTAQIATVSQGDGTQQSFTYDNYNGAIRVKTATDGLGRVTKFNYDQAGQTTVTDPFGNNTVYAYDAAKQLRSVTAPPVAGVSQVTSFTYDAKGNVKTITDPRQLVTTYEYDANGNRVSETDTAGNKLTRSYDPVSNNLLTETRWGDNAAQYTTSYAYDAANRLRFIVSPEGRVQEFTYNSAGQRASMTAYSAALLPAGSAMTDGALFTWANTLAPASSGASRTDYQYDARGLVTSTTTYATSRALQTPIGWSGAVPANMTASGNNLAVSSINQTGSAITSIASPYFDAGTNVQMELTLPSPLTASMLTIGLHTNVNRDQLLRAVFDGSALSAQVQQNGGTPSYPVLGQLKAGATYVVEFTTQSNGDVAMLVYEKGQDRSTAFSQRLSFPAGAKIRLFAETRNGPAAAGGTAGAVSTTQIRNITTSVTPAPTNALTTGYVYDMHGQVLQSLQQAADGSIASTLYTYDSLGRRLSVQDALPNPTTTLSTYNGSNRTVQVTQANGLVTSTVYDASGRVLTTAQYDGNHTLLSSVTNSYDKNGRLRLADAGNGQRTYSLYDAAGRLTGQIDANGNLTAYLYNADNQLIRTIAYAKPVNPAQLLDSDSNWRQLVAADLNPDPTNSRSTWSAYDNAGRLTVTVDATGSVTRYVYDQASRLVQTIRRAKPADIALFGAAPLAAGFDTDARGDDQITRNYYDNDGLLRAVVDGLGYLSEYRYDGAGQRVATILHQSALTASYLDGKPALAALLTASGAVASHERYFYNSQNQLAATLDNANYLTVLSYDSNGNVLSRRRYSTPVSAPAAATLAELGYTPNSAYQGTTYTYTRRNQLETETANDGIVTRYIYDKLGRLTDQRVTASSLGSIAASQRYDLQGHVVAELNAEGAARLAAAAATGTATTANIEAIWNTYATTYTYNEHGLRLSATAPQLSAGTVARETRYYYDAQGNLRYAINAMGEVTALTYNGFNQLQTSTQLAARVAPDLLATLHGGQNDNSVFNQLEALRSATLDSKQSYEYDGDGHQTAVIDALGYRSTVTYDSFGQAIASEQQSVANGNVSSAATNPGGRKVYDADGRLRASLGTDGTLTVYSYNVLGQLSDRITYAKQVSYAISADDLAKKIADPAQADGAHDSHQRYYYNARGLLATTMTAEGVANGKLLWSVVKNDYDGNGNLSIRTAYATRVPSDDAAPPAALSPADADGDGITVYSYDAANRVRSTASAQAKVANSSNRTWSISRNTYDALGNLQSVTSFAALRTGLTPGVADLDAYNPVSNLNAVTWYTYDSTSPGRIKTVATAQNVTTTNNVTTVNWAVSERFYDALGQLKSTTQYATAVTTGALTTQPGSATANPATDRVTGYEYDAAGRLSITTDAENGRTQLAYDAKGNVITRTQLGIRAADNRITRLYYDLDNRLQFSVDAEGDVTEQRYDTQGNVAASVRYTQVVKPELLTEQLSSLTTVLKSGTSDRTERYMYDSNHRLVYTIDGRGYLTEHTYDAFGRVASTLVYPNTVQPAGFDVAAVNKIKAAAGKPDITSVEYDAQGNLLKSTDAMGFTQSYAYDALGHKIQYTNQMGNVWDYAYDAAGRLSKETAPPVTVYKNGDNDKSVGTAVRLVTLLEYDGLGNLKSRTEASNTDISRVTAYGYDLAGHQQSTTSQAFANYVSGADPQASTPTETAPIAPRAVVNYDMLGNAYSNTDAAGLASYKFYDRLGRVRDEVDAAGYLTHYDRNEFGDVKQLTRYAAALGDPKAPGAANYVKPDTGTNDRAINTQYDRLGRAIKVTEPQVLVYDQAGIAGLHTYQSARTTDTRYNSFGEVYLQSVYGSYPLGNGSTGQTAAANTRFYYDQSGNKVAQINTLQDTDSAKAGYLTTYAYDGAGNLTEQLESATALNGASAWNDTGYDKTRVIVDNAGDRKTVYAYDDDNRKTSETRVGAQADANGKLSDIVTRYDYDAVGNLTRTTAANGTATIQYYDALGRTTWLAQVAPANDTTKMPVTELRLDAMGNTVVRIDYASANPAGVPAVIGKLGAVAAPTAKTDPSDRITLTSYDRAGHATTLTDALNNVIYRSYDRYGRLAKQWQSVTSLTPTGTVTETVFQITQYDALGHVQNVITPGNIDLITANAAPPVNVQTISRYNAFGELTSKTTIGGGRSLIEKTDYDNAGHAWRSNVGDGVSKITLFDAQGNATVVMRGAAPAVDPRLSSIDSAANAATVLTMGNIQRVDTRYDLLGHTVDVSALHGNDLYFLTYDSSGSWNKQVLAPGMAMPEGLLIIGDSTDLKAAISVSYRIKGSQSDWITLPARVQQINGYVVFNTGGLVGGTYEYQVNVQPEGGAAYQRDGGELTITQSTASTKTMDVIGLYLLILGRPPEPAGLDYWVGRLNNGATLATVASEMLSQGKDDPLKDDSLKLNSDIALTLKEIIEKNLGMLLTKPEGVAAFTKWLPAFAQDKGQALVDLMRGSDAILGQQKTSVYDYYNAGGLDYKTAQNAAAYARTSNTDFEQHAKDSAALEKTGVQLARVYIALFGRAPDKTGFDWWKARIDNKSMTVDQVAANFFSGDEWLKLVPAGSLSDAQFNEQLINRAYINLLGRLPTTSEFAQWSAELQDATPQTLNAKRGQLIVKLGETIATSSGGASSSFSLSDRSHLFTRVVTSLQYATWEAQGVDIPTQIALGGAVLQGLTANPALSELYNQVKIYLEAQSRSASGYAGAVNGSNLATPLAVQQLQLARVYAAVLGRAPDLTGFRFWSNALTENSKTLASVANDMLNDKEGTGRYPKTMLSSAFVTAVYQNAFGSAPSTEQLAKWTNDLDSNTKTRGAVLVDILNTALSATDASGKPGRDLFNSRVGISLTYALNASGDDQAVAAQVYNAVILKDGVVDTSTAMTLLQAATKQLAIDTAKATADAAAKTATLMANTAQAALVLNSANTSIEQAKQAAANYPMAAAVLRSAQLYAAILGRGAPNAAGLDLSGFFNQARDFYSGKGEVDAAQWMINSPEATTQTQPPLYPIGMTGAAFVRKFYSIISSGGAISDADALQYERIASTRNGFGAAAISMLNNFLAATSADNTTAANDAMLRSRQGYDQRVATILSNIASQANTAANNARWAVIAAGQSQTAVDTATNAAQSVTDAINGATTVQRSLLDITRLYMGILNRDPSKPIDIDGLTNWLRHAQEHTKTMEQIAQDFLDSDEGKKLFGGLTNAQFVDKIFLQVLGHTAEPGNWWVQRMDQGNGRGATAWGIIRDVTESTVKLVSELNGAAAFDQRIATMLTTMANSPITAAQIKATTDPIKKNYANQFVTAVNPTIGIVTKQYDYAKAESARLTALDSLVSAKANLGAANWSDLEISQYYSAMSGAASAIPNDVNLSNAMANLAAASIGMAMNARDTAAASLATTRVAQTIQMYTLVLNRAPTLQEVNVALQLYQGGVTMESLAKDLIAANPSRYPAGMTDTDFVIQLFLSFRDTPPPDSDGRRFWINALTPPNARTRGQLVGDIIDSLVRVTINADSVAFDKKVQVAASAVAKLAQAAANNPDVMDFLNTTAIALQKIAQKVDAAALAAMTPAARAAAQMVQLDVVLLGRLPEPSGLLNGIPQLADTNNANANLLTIVNSMLNSAEFGFRIPAGLSNTDFVNAFYQKGLGLTLGASELTALAAQLTNGQISRAQLAINGINSVLNYNGDDNAKISARTALQVRYADGLSTTASLINNYSAVLQSGFATTLSDKLKNTARYYHDGITIGIDNKTIDGTPIATAIDNQTVDRWGNVIRQQDARDANWITTYQYNDANQLIGAARTGYLPDANGVVQKTVLTNGTVYDSMGHVASTTDARHNTTSYRYDAAGTLLQEFHADNTTATASVAYTNDAFGQHTVTTQNTGSNSPAVVTSYAYDKLGHQASRTTASVDVYYNIDNGELKTTGSSKDVYRYDQLGRRISVTSTTDSGTLDPNATTTVSTRYDLNGNIISTTDALGQQTLSAYDTFNHKVAEKQVEIRNGNDYSMIKSWYVDNYGRVDAFIGADYSQTTYKYNAAGQVLSQIMTRAGATLQNLAYTYEDGTGLLVSIDDKILNQLSAYTYDRAGNRLTEKVWLKLQGRALQDQTLRYDAFNRLTDITSTIPGADYQIHYTYDENGNRRSESTAFTNDNQDQKRIVVNYEYDAMNRQTKLSGSITTNVIHPSPPPQPSGPPLDNDGSNDEPRTDPHADQITSVTGHTIQYDWLGNRIMDTANDQGAISIEKYSYDALGRLSQVTDSLDRTIGERHYDSAGRVVYSMDKNGDEQYNRYDILGRIKQQITNKNGGFQDHTVDYGEYDRYGDLKSYKVTTRDGRIQQTVFDYEPSRDGYRQVWTTVTNIGGNSDTKATKQEYDGNGNLMALSEYDQAGGTRKKYTTYLSDSDGHVLEKSQDGLVTHSLIANGQLVGSSNINYESFSSGYIPATAPAATNAPSVYVVQNDGETLLSVAKAIYGDQNLWYLIADANGGISSELRVGQQLVIPSRVNTISNNYQTFRPYDKGEAVGPTAPELAMPAAPETGCGPIGTVIMVVVAVVVAYYTGDYAISTFGGTGSTGAVVAGSAVGAAAGSVASQGVGIAIGAQDSFSWKAVGLAAVSGAVTGGVGAWGDASAAGSALNGPGWQAVAARAALSNTITQGIGIVTGLQQGFSWRSVAASYAGAAVGDTVGNYVSENKIFSALGDQAAINAANRAVTGFAAGLTTAVARGGRIAVTQIATDAFGNALGSSLANIASGGSENSASSSTKSISREQVERNTYGGMTSRQLFAGDKDWLGTLGVYDSPYAGDEQTPNYQVQTPKIVINGDVEQQLNAKFGLTPTSIGQAQAQTQGSAENYAARFGQGLLGAVKAVTTEPVLQLRDMALAGASVAYNEVLRSKGDPMWFPEMRSGIAGAYASGTSRGKLLLQSNFVTGTGVFAYDATTAFMNGRYGDLAEMAGGVAGGLAIGKFAQKFGGYGLTVDDIGGQNYGPLASQRGSIGLKIITPDWESPAGTYREGNAIIRLGDSGEVRSLFTKITSDDLGTGTPTTESARALARSLGLVTDDAGHIVGRQLGGLGGSTSGNIFPQTPNINRGAFAQFESELASTIRGAESGHAFVRVVPEYLTTSATRPTGITYQIRIDGQTVTRRFGN